MVGLVLSLNAQDVFLLDFALLLEGDVRLAGVLIAHPGKLDLENAELLEHAKVFAITRDNRLDTGIAALYEPS